RARGGPDQVSSLTLACRLCNERKGTQTAEEFGYPAVQAQAEQPLRDAAPVNATRWALFRRLRALGLPLETGTGRTKWNRTQRQLPKTHWLDAACVGASTLHHLRVAGLRPLLITATGRHARQLCRMDRFGFPRTGPKATSRVGDCGPALWCGRWSRRPVARRAPTWGGWRCAPAATATVRRRATAWCRASWCGTATCCSAAMGPVPTE